jgi:hypothetical protein
MEVTQISLGNDSLHVWKGYSRLGYWKRVSVSLKKTCLIVTETSEGAVRYRILLRLLTIKPLKKNQFSITCGLKTLYFRCAGTAQRNAWVGRLWGK